ncbi:MAG: phosphotransferase [Bdellovibrionota bacterium]
MALHLNLEKKDLSRYLQGSGWIDSNETVSHVSKAGDGNMNLTLRVQTNSRQFILKQSRPWVEKYPHIEAPQDRILTEACFYEIASRNFHLKKHMPNMIHLDQENRIMMLEDLGNCPDLTTVYHDQTLQTTQLDQLLTFLDHLYATSVSSNENKLHNREMRTLNHFHIFVFPFEPHNGLNLDQHCHGLSRIASHVCSNEPLKKKIADYGKRYLADGDTLLHGDFFPGSWLQSENHMYVIDPEFCFLGPKEFDVGILQAHLLLAKHPVHIMADILEKLRHHHLISHHVESFCGIEMLRRLLGVAQLPLSLNLEEREYRIELAMEMILSE